MEVEATELCPPATAERSLSVSAQAAHNQPAAITARLRAGFSCASIVRSVERLRALSGLHPHDRSQDNDGLRRGHWNPLVSHARKAEELARTCPDFCANIDASAFEGDLKWVGDWDSEQIGVWFSERRIKAGVGPDRSYGELQKRKRLWGSSRWVEIDTHEGWAIPNGLSSYLLIMLDGRVWQGDQAF